MKISPANHEYLKLWKDPLKKYLCVFQYKFCNKSCHFYIYHEIYFYVFLHSKTEKNIKIWQLRNIAFTWYISSLKPKGKGDCKNLIHFSSVSCPFIFFNLFVKVSFGVFQLMLYLGFCFDLILEKYFLPHKILGCSLFLPMEDNSISHTRTSP